ncbi:MAG: DUF484 family protein [Alphaproteobacteria bacterium]
MATKAGTKPKADPITAEQVVQYLADNPDFFVANADLFEAMAAPERKLGGGVTDFQQAMILRLRDKIERTEDVARVLIDTSRDNMSTQARIHDGVLALLDASSFELLIQTVTVDLAVMLDLDVVNLCVETTDKTVLPVGNLVVLPGGAIDSFIGKNQTIALDQDVSADPLIFGSASPLVQSQALVRLEISDMAPPAVLAFGSRDNDRFHPGQATELLHFLARVLETQMRIWLDQI